MREAAALAGFFAMATKKRKFAKKTARRTPRKANGQFKKRR